MKALAPIFSNLEGFNTPPTVTEPNDLAACSPRTKFTQPSAEPFSSI